MRGLHILFTNKKEKKMEKIIKESEARKGVAVTYITKAGGIGFGYLLGEDVYKSGGNGFYYVAEDILNYLKDGGAQYRKAIRGIGLYF